MSNNNQDKNFELLGQVVAFIIILNCQAWLTRFCFGLVAPEFFLEFWQWLVVVFTIRWIAHA